MNSPKQYVAANVLQRDDFAETLAKFSSWLTWGEDECDVLDVGCGSGDVTRDVLRPSLQCNNPRIVGVDVSQAMVDFARTSCTDELQFHVMDIATSQNPRHTFPNGFDKIYSNYCLHWVQDQRTAIQNLYDLLRPGGEMILVFLGYHPVFQAFQYLAAKPKWSPFMKNVKNFVSPYQNSQHPDRELRKILESSGFIVECCECHEKTYTFKSYEEMRACVAAVNTFKANLVSPEMCEKFVDAMMENLDNTVKNEDGTCSWSYRLFQVFARKSVQY